MRGFSEFDLGYVVIVIGLVENQCAPVMGHAFADYKNRSSRRLDGRSSP